MSQRLDSLSDKVCCKIIVMKFRFFQFSTNSENIEEKIKQLEALKLAASSDSPSDAFMCKTKLFTVPYNRTCLLQHLLQIYNRNLIIYKKTLTHCR